VKTPNVNFFFHYVPCLDGLGINHPLSKKYSKARIFYACEQSYSYLNYVNEGSKNKVDFVSYSGNSEKSTGVFDKDGLCNKQRLKELKEGLCNTKSPIWHGLISFEELFGDAYCDDYEKAYKLMRNEFPRFLKTAGFDVSNIEWFAGLHTNTDNKHIHFSFYEKQPLRYRKKSKQKTFSNGPVSLFSMEQMKIRSEVFLTDINSKINKKRTELTTSMKDNLNSNLNKREVFKKMKKLVLILPTKGRVSYDSENMIFLKNDINYLIDLIIKSDKNTTAVYKTFLTLLQEKDMSIKRMCLASKIDPDKVMIYEKYKNDLYRRLGNIVIQEIVNSGKELKTMEFKTQQRLVKKRIERNKTNFLIDQSLHLGEKVKNEAFNYFKQHMKVLEEMRIKVLIEQGVIEI